MASTRITLTHLHSFHSLDRELFVRLVVILHHDPDLPNMVINQLAKEAVACLRWVQSKVPPISNLAGDMPITTVVMDRAMSFQYFYKIRFTMISGIKNYLNNVCSIIFADILFWVLSKGYPTMPLNFPIHVPGFPHQTFGIITVIRRSLDYIILNKNGPLTTG
ncbi:hypothetical protein H5410_041485 [Solanum commersonii]|uniref:Uncharacterized protein n=1 Tax=Solanum commersonii TaxID=4109 RepID=A0A9J5XRQ4_SOLCO|nr:hypothetical protein H5410_041485 [Solanum commersonii]